MFHVHIEFDDAPPVPPPPTHVKGVSFNDYNPYALDDLGEFVCLLVCLNHY